MIKTYAFPRVSIAGNPSDGFWGKCVSMSFSNFSAKCIILPSNKFKIKNENKLIKAVIKTFFEYCRLNNIKFKKKKFSLRYKSNIPFRLGFSGSTALSISVIRALNKFYSTKIPDEAIENIALHAETKWLKRYAGPQDPVCVNKETCLYMDFSKEAYKKKLPYKNNPIKNAAVHVDYSSSKDYLINPVKTNIQKLKISKDFIFFIIYGKEGSDSSVELSPNVKAYRKKNKKIIKAMKKISVLAIKAKKAILKKDKKRLGEIINKNFYLSVKYFDRDYLGNKNISLVEETIKLGAYAKFPGSGGAVLGLCLNSIVFKKIKKHFEKKGFKTERIYMPKLLQNQDEEYSV